MMEEISFKIIASCGEANAEIHLALGCAANNEMDKVAEHLGNADAAINVAHIAHTTVLHREAQGEEAKYSILFSHAQDTMMNVMTLRAITEEFINIYKKIN